MDIQGKRIVEFGEQALSDSKEGHNILFLSPSNRFGRCDNSGIASQNYS